MLLGALSCNAALVQFLPVSDFHLWSEAGHFLPNAGGPWHRPGSSGAASARSPVHQASYQEGTDISPSSKHEGSVALNSCSLPLRHGTIP